MSNSYYTHGAFPSTGSAATSASMRAELDLVTQGFDKLPTLAGGSANQFVVLSSTGLAMTTTSTLPAASVNDTQFTIQNYTDNTKKFQFLASGITSGTTRIYTMPDANDTMVGRATTDTLTNKTLTSPVIGTIVNTGTLTLPTSTDTLVGRDTADTLTNKTLTSPTINNGTLTSPIFSTIVNTGTLTLPTTTDTLVGRNTTDTLTNKTLTLPTIASINNGGTITIPSGVGTFATIAATQTLTNKTLTNPTIGTILNTGTLTLPTSTDTLVGRDTTDTLTNKTLTSPVIGTIINTGTLTLPTTTGTLVGRTTIDTLTNKTLTSPVISTIVNTGTLTLPTSTDTLVGRATTDTLTNKTLTTPVISSISNTGTLTLPTSTDTLVGRATTDTLTNKSLSGSTNTFTNIPNSGLTNSSLTVGTTAISLGSSSLTLGGLTSVAVTQDPTSNLQLATKQYVDTQTTTGLSFHDPVQASTTGTLASITGGTVTYNNGTAGVGATLTLSVALTTLDGYTLANTNRILVKDEAAGANNGVYTWATGGTVLTRATDANSYGTATNQIRQNSYFYTQNGTVNKGNSYVITTVGTITFGTTGITFAQFSGSQTYTASTGLTLTGTAFSIDSTVTTLTGTQTLTNKTLTNPAINGATIATGTINNTPIGGTTAAAGAFTTLSASSTVSGTGFSTYLASPPAIGGTAAAAGAFTTLSASSTVSGTGFSTYLASPPAIGGTAAAAITGTTITANTQFSGPHNGTVGATTANTGAFTTLSASSTVSGTGFSTYLASPPAIGGTTAAAGAFTTLSASSTVSGTGFSTYLASPPAIGGTAAAAGAFTTLSASSTVSGTGFSTYLASPPAIGGTTAAAGAFTTLSASSTVSGTGFSTYLASPPAIGGTTANTGRFTSVTNTGLTSGRVTYATTSGLLTDSASLAFNGTNFTNSAGYVSASTDFRLGGLSYSRVAIGDGGGGFVGGYNITYSAGPVYDSTAPVAGIYNGSDGNLKFYSGASATAGTAAPEGMRLTSTGLGIGTTSPTAGYKLDVSGAIRTTSNLYRSNYGTIASGTSGNGFARYQGYFVGATNHDIASLSVGYDAYAATFDTAQGQASAIQLYGADASPSIRFYTGQLAANFLERMRIDNAGNVGIGTSSPGSKLQVNGSVSFASGNVTFDTNGSLFTQGNTISSNVPNGAVGINAGPSGGIGLYVTNKAGNTGYNSLYVVGIASQTSIAQVIDSASNNLFSIAGSGKIAIGPAAAAVTLAVSATDAILVPAGTTAQRPTGAAGYIRYNSTLAQFEGYTTAWGSIGGGATGASGEQVFWENEQTVDNSYTITAGKNAGTFGPITVATGVTVTVPTGSTWSIV